MHSAFGPKPSTPFHVWRRVAIAVGIALLTVLSALPGRAQDGGYVLGAGDTLDIRVLAWNSLDLEFELYDGLGGTFRIDEDGSVVLPLLGSVSAGGMGIAALSDQIGKRYQRRLGLAETPSASIEVSEYRPVFVLGDVARPGRYEYEPGLTATGAMALAGGLYRPEDGGGFGEAIRATGRLDELSGDLTRERMRTARLRAEVDGAEAFETPDLPPHPDGPEAAQALYEHEASLFDGRRQQVDSALASIDETRALLRTEIAALEEKGVGIARQLDLVRESVGNMESLRERGLARSPTLITLQQTLIDLEARELDTETGIFRARQQLSELDRDAGDLRAGRRVQVLQDLQTSEAEIARLESRLETTGEYLTVAQALLAASASEVRVRPEFVILRGAEARRIDADGTTPLAPLDVLEVETTAVEPD
ncbi:polysaccharide biosynthesis/export family protein [Jannaschia rubra]|uniref:Type I secretion system membrane fusion protein PrsE n=1 Tax=Jannaschia rubra TaxID=282197 RepID=A0A0M6XNF3_9RHOB|nr:polysaccharide biosynthesis/export family protein [Jannaschia rubra]CTQ32710.1 Type I secretion system membrane fusion protein PrsE [Jannaschia rubra]SFF87999.1 exopolysaccharide production protein ExoF [Jannaschia rubra]